MHPILQHAAMQRITAMDGRALLLSLHCTALLRLPACLFACLQTGTPGAALAGARSHPPILMCHVTIPNSTAAHVKSRHVTAPVEHRLLDVRRRLAQRRLARRRLSERQRAGAMLVDHLARTPLWGSREEARTHTCIYTCVYVHSKRASRASRAPQQACGRQHAGDGLATAFIPPPGGFPSLLSRQIGGRSPTHAPTPTHPPVRTAIARLRR